MKAKLTLLALMAAAAPLFAHHGTNASYDMDKTITVTGTVTEFVWSNPHCQLYLDVKDADGKVVSWGAETNSPGNLKAAGWTRDIVKPGDKVTGVFASLESRHACWRDSNADSARWQSAIERRRAAVAVVRRNETNLLAGRTDPAFDGAGGADCSGFRSG